MALSKFDRWLIAESIDSERQYIVHTHTPRFVAEILYDAEGGNYIDDFDFIDEPPADPQYLAQVMREAGQALAEYDNNLGI